MTDRSGTPQVGRQANPPPPVAAPATNPPRGGARASGARVRPQRLAPRPNRSPAPIRRPEPPGPQVAPPLIGPSPHPFVIAHDATPTAATRNRHRKLCRRPTGTLTGRRTLDAGVREGPRATADRQRLLSSSRRPFDRWCGVLTRGDSARATPLGSRRSPASCTAPSGADLLTPAARACRSRAATCCPRTSPNA